MNYGPSGLMPDRATVLDKLPACRVSWVLLIEVRVPYERADSITIRSTDYSETSLVLVFYTREYGRISALAKGAKRKSSGLIGNIDLFSHGEIIFASGRTRDKLNILTEADAAETFSGVRASLPRFYAACHAAELLLKLTAVEDPNAELFERMLGLLRALDKGTEPAVALLAFEAHLLVLSGFMPQVAGCVSCGKPVKGRTIEFAWRRGGVICADCAPEESGFTGPAPGGALALLGRLAAGKVTKLERVTISPQVGRQARAFLNQYEAQLVGRELRTARHLA